MKKIFLALTLASSFAIANTYSDVPDQMPEPNSDPNQGTGSQAVPLDTYTGLLLAFGILTAGVIYYNNEKQIVKK